MPSSASYLERNIRTVLARAYVRVVGVNREPSWIFFSVTLPLLSLAAYVYIYKQLNAPEEFIGYVVLGGAMTAFWLNMLWGMGTNFYWEKETGNLEQYLVAPISRMAILLGMASGGMFNTTVRATATIILGAILFDVSFTLDHPFQLLAIFILTMISLYGMGMLFTSLFLMYGREAWHTANILTEPVYLLSGFYFPMKYLGFYTALAASIIPISLGLDGMRQVLVPSSADHGFLPVWTEILILAGLCVIFLLLARHALHYMENLAKKKGRLTLRWQ